MIDHELMHTCRRSPVRALLTEHTHTNERPSP